MHLSQGGIRDIWCHRKNKNAVFVWWDPHFQSVLLTCLRVEPIKHICLESEWWFQPTTTKKTQQHRLSCVAAAQRGKVAGYTMRFGNDYYLYFAFEWCAAMMCVQHTHTNKHIARPWQCARGAMMFNPQWRIARAMWYRNNVVGTARGDDKVICVVSMPNDGH